MRRARDTTGAAGEFAAAVSEKEDLVVVSAGSEECECAEGVGQFATKPLSTPDEDQARSSVPAGTVGSLAGHESGGHNVK